MEPFRLRMKIGAHEFEAEGEQEYVERQFALWREMIANVPTSASPPPPTPSQPVVVQPGTGEATWTGHAPIVSVGSTDTAGYDKIFHRAGKMVSLTVLPNGEHREADGGLLVLLGQRHYNQLDRVGGGLLLQGLQQSGYSTQRVDRILERHIPEFVLRDGSHRAVRYRLNNQGFNRAKELAKELIAMVP